MACPPTKPTSGGSKAPRRGGAAPMAAAAILVVAFLLALPAAAVRAQIPASADSMVATGIHNLHLRLEQALPAATTATATLNAIREISDMRRMAQRVVAMGYPLDDFTGIILVDRYDEAYIATLDTLVAHFTALDRTPPNAASAALFRDRLGELPPLGDTPAGFVVTYVIGRCAAAGSRLPDTLSAEGREGIEEVAVRSIGELAASYLRTRVGENRMKSDDFWHQTVIERMLCPAHRSAYTLEGTRSGLKPDGSIFRRYVVRCEKGGEERRVDFDLGVIGELSRSGGRQNLKKPVPPAAGRKPGVEP